MQTSHPSSRSSRLGRLYLAVSTLALAALALLSCVAAQAQGSVPLVTVATDQSQLNLSNKFGVPSDAVVDQAGDFAFVGDGNSALFNRPAGASSATRLLQAGDGVPGFPTSRVISFSPIIFRSSTQLLFAVSFDLADAIPHQALLTFDGSNYHTIVSDTTVAPGTGGLPYGATFTPVGVNDNGDVAFTAVPTVGTTLFIVPAGGTAVRLVDNGDLPPAPLTGTFAFVTLISNFNNLGQILFQASTTTTESNPPSLFLASKNGQVVAEELSANAACLPNPSIDYGFLNNAGVAAFIEFNTTTIGICSGPAGAPAAETIAAGTAAPASIGGTLFLTTFCCTPQGGLQALDDSGDIAFTTQINGSAVTPFALLRRDAASGNIDLVAYANETAPSSNGATFVNFSAVSMATDGTVSFVASLSPSGSGLYQQTGTSAPVLVALDGQAAPVAGGGTFSLDTQTYFSQTLDSHSVFFSAIIVGGTAYFGDFLGTPNNLQPLMSTADALPSGSRVHLGAVMSQAAGNFVGFGAQQAGGQLSLFVSNLSSGTTTKIVTEGDPAPGVGGVISTANQGFFINANGQMVFGGVSMSAPYQFSPAIFLGSPSAALANIASVGLSLGTAGNVTEVALNPAPLSPLNNAGQAVFNAFYSRGSGPTLTGGNALLIHNADGSLRLVGESGLTISGVSGTSSTFDIALNQLGQAAFGGMGNNFRAGFFGWSSTTGVKKIAAVMDPISNVSGATFATPNFLSGFNNSGNLVFTGAISPALDPLTPGYSVFLGSTAGSPTVLASDGMPAPGGGTFRPSLISLGATLTGTTLQNIATNNDENDLLLRSGLTGSSSDSGYFISRGTGPQAGVLQPIVVQGQALPGGGTLGTIPTPDRPGTSFSLGSDGEFAFTNNFTNGSASSQLGLFLVRQDGSLVKVLAAGDTVPGGGSANGIQMSQNLAGGSAGTFAFWAGITGGNASEAIYATAIPAGTVPTTIALVSSQNPSNSGQSIVFTASVTSTASGTPTGAVTFFDNGTSIGTGTLNGSGQATLTISSLASGSHPITAQYGGDANFAPKNSPVVTQTVNMKSTSTAVTSSLNSSASGQSVTLTATVTSTAGGVPTGTVTFLDGTTSIGTGTLNSSGQATLAIASLTVASHSITAQYGGDAAFAASTSPAVTQTVNQALFATLPSQLTATRGQNLTFTLTLFGSSSLSYTLSATNLPTNATVTFSPNPVTPTATGTTIQVTFLAAAASTSAPVQPHGDSHPLGFLGLSLAALVFLTVGIVAIWNRGKDRWAFGAILAAMILAVFVAGCGGNYSSPSSGSTTPGTPTGATSFVVVATSGSNVVMTTVNVAVQ